MADGQLKSAVDISLMSIKKTLLTECTQHEQNPLINLRYLTTNIHNLWNNGHNWCILAQSQGIFYTHQVHVVIDYYTKYEQNQPIPFWAIATNIKFKKNIAIIIQIWHRAKCYFTCMRNSWYLITAPNMNKITTFISAIQTLKIYEKIAILAQVWHRAKFCFIRISGPWYLIWRKSIQPSWRNVRGWTDWTLFYIPWFCLGRLRNNKDTGTVYFKWTVCNIRI